MIELDMNSYEMRYRLRALAIDASRARRDGLTPEEWIVSWYTPADFPREFAIDEMNELLSKYVGWTWGPQSEKAS